MRIRTYKFRDFLPYADYIGNSLSEYKITTSIVFLIYTAAIFYDTWKTDYSKKLYDKCIDITNQRLEIEPENIEYLDDLAMAYNNLANLQTNHLNAYESATYNYQRAIEIEEKIIKISATPNNIYSLAMYHNNHANLQVDHMNDSESAVKNYNKAIKILKKLTKTIGDIEYLSELARAYYNLANLQDDYRNDSKSAETNYNKVILIGQQIRTISKDPVYLNQLSAAYNNIAVLKKKQKKYESAIENSNEAIKIQDIIKDTNLECFVNWINSKNMLAKLYIATDNLTDARKIVNEIKAETEKLIEEYPKYSQLRKVNRLIKETESMLNQ